MAVLMVNLRQEHGFPKANGLKISQWAKDQGANISAASFFAWTTQRQDVSPENIHAIAKLFGRTAGELNAFLNGSCTLDAFKAGQCQAEPLDEEDAPREVRRKLKAIESQPTELTLDRILRWMVGATPEELIAIARTAFDTISGKVTNTEFETIQEVLDLALHETMNQVRSNAEGLKMSKADAMSIALEQFSKAAGLSSDAIKFILAHEDIKPSPQEVNAIALAIGWQPEDLQALCDRQYDPQPITAGVELVPFIETADAAIVDVHDLLGDDLELAGGAIG